MIKYEIVELHVIMMVAILLEEFIAFLSIKLA